MSEDKISDLGKFDGNVTFDCTQGTLAARCYKRANNFLALNLAHDIINGRKIEQARKVYGDLIKEKMNDGNPVLHAKTYTHTAGNATRPTKIPLV